MIAKIILNAKGVERTRMVVHYLFVDHR